MQLPWLHMARNEPIRVWVVEDDPHYRDTLSFIVENSTGMMCTGTFAQVEHALAAVDGSTVPDVVLMDIQLPGCDGIAGTTRLAERLPSARVVMLTNYDDDDRIFDAFRAGASGYLLKNVPVDKILAAIHEAASGGMLMPAPVARKVRGYFADVQANRGRYGLTSREREVLDYMADGLSQKEIAATLFLSPSTINGHVQHIYQKLHVNSGSAAVAKALREHLI